MNKTELVAEVAVKTGITKSNASRVVKAIFDSIQAALAKGEKVQLVGFGSFEVHRRAARKGRNPQTGAEIEIPEADVPVFRAGLELKRAVKKGE